MFIFLLSFSRLFFGLFPLSYIHVYVQFRCRALARISNILHRPATFHPIEPSNGDTHEINKKSQKKSRSKWAFSFTASNELTRIMCFVRRSVAAGGQSGRPSTPAPVLLKELLHVQIIWKKKREEEKKRHRGNRYRTPVWAMLAWFSVFFYLPYIFKKNLNSMS